MTADALPAEDGYSTTSFDFIFNGAPHRLTVDTRMTLLDTLQEETGLTGAEKGSDHGQCGACVILIDVRRELSGLTLAVASEGRDVVTI